MHTHHAFAHMNALRPTQAVDAPSPYGDPMTGGVNTGNGSADAPRFSWKVAPALARSLRTRACVWLCAPSNALPQVKDINAHMQTIGEQHRWNVRE